MIWQGFWFGAPHLPAWILALRAIVLYLTLVAATRWMGHRQVGILSGHNYLTAAGIVSIAALRMVHAEASLIAGLAVVGLYAGVNVLLSKLDLRWPRFVDRQPIPLIAEGHLRPENLRKARVTLDELLGLLRLGKCPRLSDAWSAVLEPTGRLSVIKKTAASPVTRADWGLPPVPVGSSVVLLREGRVNREGLQRIGRDETWLRNTLQRQYGITDLRQVLAAVLEPDGTLLAIPVQPRNGG